MNSSQTDAKLKEEWRKTRAGVMKRCDERIKKVGYAKFFFFSFTEFIKEENANKDLVY